MFNSAEFNWLTILFVVFAVSCFYLTLTFMEAIKNGDKRVMLQSKRGAIICFTLALLIAILL